MSEPPSPEDVLAGNDPGDDTARRFAYQWAWAAILSCGLYDNTLDIVELFCEHHEDILLKHQDGSFSGWQIKTRDLGSDPWKAADEPILSALVRFARLEKDFPGRFRSYVLATNHTFLTGKKTKYDLPHLLELARLASDESTMQPKLRTLVRKIAGESEADDSTVLAALKKSRTDDSLPKLAHIKQALIHALNEAWPHAADQALDALRNAADALIGECQRASSLDHTQSLPAYMSASPDPGATDVQATIDGKRIDRTRLDHVLGAAAASPSLLVSGAACLPSAGAEGNNPLVRKLAAGGFSGVFINSATDLQAKAEYQAVAWQMRYGETKGLERYEHIRSLVLHDCASAHETAKASTDPFGKAMLKALRESIQGRRERGGATLLDCLDEHLEGYAYSLTNACEVWWVPDPPNQGGA
jgi:hypothetical protein